jgi:hypothetical protein
MSGAGKSILLSELARRGHRVIDTDDAGWIVEAMTADGPEPLWDLDRVRALLDEHKSGWLFVAGCVANQGVLYCRFDKVVLLRDRFKMSPARLLRLPAGPAEAVVGDRGARTRRAVGAGRSAASAAEAAPLSLSGASADR